MDYVNYFKQSRFMTEESLVIRFYHFMQKFYHVHIMLLQLISATDRHRQSTDHPIKFISRRPPYTLKFKIKPGIYN